MPVEYKGKKFKVKKKEGLMTLDLSFKGIKNITEIKGLELLTDLQVLDLYGNEITEIKGLDTLNNLVKLRLGRNKIAKIEGLKNIANLEQLQLQYNEIKVIEGLDNLVKLSSLNLRGNEISYVESFKNKNNLKEFHLYQNPLYDRVKETFGMVTSQNMIRYAQMSEEEKNRMEQETNETLLRKETEQSERERRKRKIDNRVSAITSILGIIFISIGLITLNSQGFSPLAITLLVIGALLIGFCILLLSNGECCMRCLIN